MKCLYQAKKWAAINTSVCVLIIRVYIVTLSKYFQLEFEAVYGEIYL
jgi:hypothetical protein